MIKRSFIIETVGEEALLTVKSYGVMLKINVSLIAPGVLNADVWTKGGERMSATHFLYGTDQHLIEITEGIVSIEIGEKRDEAGAKEWTLVDELLCVSQPVSATQWRQLHQKAMQFLKDNPVVIPDPSKPLPDGATLAERENWLMLQELNSRKSGEHYSSFMYRIYGLARAVRSLRTTQGDTFE